MKIAVDFDGTIVTNEYPKIGKEMPFAIDVLKRLQAEEHYQIILWTVRVDQSLDEAIEFCRERGLEFYAVNKNYPDEVISLDSPRKLNVDLFIDDRNLGGLPEWGKIYQKIKGIEEEDDNYSQKRRNPYKPKNLILRLGEWLDSIGNEMDKRKGY
ncbi:MAG TPA: hypothetical protein PLN63_08330 [Paludibacteraceae bacterium]|jgi:hypothetical protein|nr:hypothetical protein [Paludibacteraceae bacterium]HOU68135.1 hypothetical protein [Paludibacteraceae bacterium]HPH63607.1 hypothetical protein [Paludibacteraceae bacterium]HQF50055.1 hypothetical protein [Paludibacteraceae bacterium]HQJ89537.1 hypothetical protein [Paludibacteraceae bacterium]